MAGMIAAFSITPLGAGASVSEPVAEAVRLVRQSGLPNETNAMFTNVEGDWDQVMALIKACVMKVAEVTPRVSVVIRPSPRRGRCAAEQGRGCRGAAARAVARRGVSTPNARRPSPADLGQWQPAKLPSPPTQRYRHIPEALTQAMRRDA
jgi:uncharacterized protein (TIGR00106 family)